MVAKLLILFLSSSIIKLTTSQKLPCNGMAMMDAPAGKCGPPWKSGDRPRLPAQHPNIADKQPTIPLI
jgi:hypothetical protein